MFRPGNSIQAKAYAANAAIITTRTVAGIVMMKLLTNAWSIPARPRTYW